MAPLPASTLSTRLVFICFVAAAVGLPVAIISISKAIVLLTGLVSLLWLIRRPFAHANLSAMHTPGAVLMALAGLALTLLWTAATMDEALGAWAKHAKLLLIPLLLFLIRSRQDALFALATFVGLQIFLLASSWMLWLKLPVPWATSNMALTEYAVFSSRLDQPIMSSILAAVCWHLRHLAPGRAGRYLAITVVIAALANVLFVMQGRTGHVVVIALISLAIMWELPKPYRLLAGAAPFLLLLVFVVSSSKVRDRMDAVIQEVGAYAKTNQMVSSSGERLNYWYRSVQSIAEHPLTGSGVGSWHGEYKRLDRGRAPASTLGVRNPHQEYLLWGVEAGLIGIALLCHVLLALYRDSLKMSTANARATQSVLAALAISCLFNSSIYDATIGDFFCVSLGLLMALGFHSVKKSDQLPFSNEVRS